MSSEVRDYLDKSGAQRIIDSLKDKVLKPSDLDELTAALRLTKLLADESDFKAEANFRAFSYRFDYLCIENFHDTADIDPALYDGATIISEYYDSKEYLINKTSSDTLTICSNRFRLEDNPYHVLIYLDWGGTGNVATYFSKDNGDTWKYIEHDTLTDLDPSVSKDVRVKIQMTGEVILKNIAWGCK